MRKIVQSFCSKKYSSKPVYIVAAKRTPIGSFLGKLSTLSATELGGWAIKGAINSIELDKAHINQVILGNVISSGLGQAPARQASIKAGISEQVPCTTINKVCSSGMKSIVFGSQSIALGHSDVVVTGGFQSMSNAPFYVLNSRKGFGYGDKKMVDAIAYDGLTDSFNNISMGLCAQKTSIDFKITRQNQDDYANQSYKRHIEAAKHGIFINQIIPVSIKDKNSETNISEDQEATRYRQEKMKLLNPAFSKTGTITAANASKINDGACAIILMSEQKVKSLNIKPLARIVNYADAQIAPIDFSIAPHYAIKKVLEKSQLNLNKIDLIEINEAFSCVVLANTKLLDIDISKVNIYGGAVAMGHPIGMSGARIIQSLITGLKNKKGKYGLAAICNGGGGSTSMIIENLQ